MTKNAIVGSLTAALLMSGALVGVSYGGGGSITEPQVIELSVSFCEPVCGFYLLDDADGDRTGQITLAKEAIFDVDGDRVGTQHASCTVSDGQGGTTAYLCTFLLALKEGPHTHRGTVTATGILSFEGDVFAVTGGTGAYEGVSGSISFGSDSYTLNLIP